MIQRGQDNTKRYYSQVAQKIGNLFRKELISGKRKKKPVSLKIDCFAKSLNSIAPQQISQKKERHRNQSFQVYTNKNYRADKKQIIKQFKQRLKQNLDESRIRRQQKFQQLANKVRWKRLQMMAEKTNKLEEFENRKRKQIFILRNIKQRSKQYLKMNKRQSELQNTFTCLERRLKPSLKLRSKDCNF